MTPLRERMLEDLRIRNLRPGTCDHYVRAIEKFSRHFRRSPETLGLEQIREYQLHLIDQGLSYSTRNIFVCAARFLYGVTLRCDWKIEHVRHAKRPKKLPAVLSRSEIQDIFRVTEILKHRAIFMVMYACGLRVAEAASLLLCDIDSKRMVIDVRYGKGGKDRTVPLPKRLLALLRAQWKEHRSPVFVFPGRETTDHIHRNTIALLLKRAAVRAGIKKRVSTHTLRHSFATHHLEDGTDMRTLQVLLGHADIGSTSGYLHISSDRLHKAGSPVDRLDTPTD